jgi:electron transfer flavoprotein beta subunit
MPPAVLLCVCLRPAWRTDVPLRLHPAGAALRGEDALAVTGPAELAALQLALTLRDRLREGLGASARVLALSVAPPAAEGVLREALAAGADEVLRVWGRDGSSTADAEPGTPAGTRSGAPSGTPPGVVDAAGDATRALARAAASVLRPRAPALVLTGERSGDSGHEVFGGFLAAELGAAFAHRATEAEPAAPDGSRWRVTVRLERGYGQVLELAAPAVITVAASLPRPGYAGLPAWLASRRAAVPALVPTIEPATPPTHAARRGETTLRVPVPRVKRYTVPGQGLSAEARIRAMVTLEAQGGGTLLSDASPEAQAEAVLRLLGERGYL